MPVRNPPRKNIKQHENSLNLTYKKIYKTAYEGNQKITLKVFRGRVMEICAQKNFI